MSDRVYTNSDKGNRLAFNMDARHAFHIIGACGIVSVLVDIDHPIAWAIQYLSEGEIIYSTRFLHTPILIWAGTLILIMCAYIGGLYIKYILGKVKGNGKTRI